MIPLDLSLYLTLSLIFSNGVGAGVSMDNSASPDNPVPTQTNATGQDSAGAALVQAIMSQSPSILMPAPDRMTTSVLQGHNRSPPASAGRPSKVARKNELQDNLNAFFNSDARDMRAREQGVSQLYALQLQEAHTTIHRLEGKIN